MYKRQEFGVAEFAELPMVSNSEPYSTTQEQQDEFQKNPYWVPFMLPAMSASNSAYFIGFGTRQAARFLFEHTLWPAARAFWSEGPAGGQIASARMTLSDLRVVEGGIGGGVSGAADAAGPHHRRADGRTSADIPRCV